MMIKRFAAFIIAMGMALSAAACGSSENSEADKPSAGRTESQREEKKPDSSLPDEPDEPSEPDPNDPNILTPPTLLEFDPLDKTNQFEENDSELDDGFKQAAADFAVKLFQQTCSGDLGSGKNAMVSPESVMLALGLAANGASGETLDEFMKLFGCENAEQMNAALSSLITSAKSSEAVKFNIANSIWVREGDRITVKPSYAEICKKRLDADSFVAPFDMTTLGALNGWVEEQTHGMIKGIKNEFTEDDVAVLINCIAFEGEWMEQYEDYQVHEDEIFTNGLGKEEKCNMLYSTEDIYLSDDNTKGFVKYYQGGRYAFAALLPDEGVSVSDYVQSLTGEKLTSLLKSRTYEYDVIARMPEFKFEWGCSLNDALQAMGLESAFREDADFSNMADTQTGLLYISDAAHKTYIELDRNGTKAAAATALTMADNAAIVEPVTVEVRLDRPFVYAIVDMQTNLPVFIGAVNSVEAE